MRHSINELIDVVHRYYPQGLLSKDPQYEESEEYHRLVAARRQAGAGNEPWCAMLERLGEQFPENRIQNRSIHLPTGNWDACYSARLFLATTPGENYHSVGFLVSFLVPYYIIYSARVVDDLEEAEKMRRSAESSQYASVSLPDFPDTMVILPAPMVKPELVTPPDATDVCQRTDIRFDLWPAEQPYAAWIAQAIEATWRGYERMPPEVGKALVPDVSTSTRCLGEATLYDCLFSDDW